ncbi:hypothetical protein GJ496_008605 [Pomphorhynchus laevis]|nr:hypothetical protein GJ496_008605 [Pomphorhynchus laevis]
MSSQSTTVTEAVPASVTAARIFQSKYAWLSPSEEESNLLSQALKLKLKQGNGEAFIFVGKGEEEDDGICDEDLEKSINNLRQIAQTINTDIHILRIKGKSKSKQADILLRSLLDSRDFMEVRVAVIGNVDSGKSTLLGVLTHGVLDDGRGTARLKLFRHKHERESGRTSSIGNEILGFDLLGNVVNKPDSRGVIQSWESICLNSTKIVTFIDLAGHEKYLKTTVFGLTGYAPDYCMLIIGANMGLVGMTKEHLGLSLALGVPVFVIITKIDMCPPNVLSDTVRILTRLLKAPGCRKMPLFVNNDDDVFNAAVSFTNERICPIFQVSNVQGDNLDLLLKFLNLLNVRKIGDEHKPVEYQVDDLYNVPGVGTVVSGTMLNGRISVNDNLFIGPDRIGEFKSVQVKSIHRKRMEVSYCSSGHTASLLLRKVKRNELRKGMVILCSKSELIAHREFVADVLILHHPTTISIKYQAMVHVGPIRQTATIIKMTAEHLRTGDRAKVRFRFISNPEYLRVNQRLVFREGRTKAVGTITEIYEEKVHKIDQTRTANLPRKHRRYIARCDAGSSTTKGKSPISTPKLK